NYGFLGARANFRPLALSVWGSDILISAKKSALHRRRASYVLRKADLLTSDSQYLSNEMLELGADFSKIATFPMGVERDIYPPPARKVSTGERINIVSTRKFEPVYNLELLIDAIPEVVKKNGRVKFIIVGEGSQGEFLKRKIENEKCFAAVEFTGSLNRADLITLLKRSDIYVSTSLSDSTSVSLLEAMSCGLIPIVTGIPGNREWVNDGVNGYLTDTRQTSSLAEKILAVSENLKNLQPLVDRNQKLIEEKADYHFHLTQLRGKFTELIDKHSKSGGL
ncbi:MAG: glycosyltransferase family 4 protein, partial [candidate division Zixibacteria bacterium]|nr:glycosyltransferase family 4 protein [candidate division Zixibacteria bacterium]